MTYTISDQYQFDGHTITLHQYETTIMKVFQFNSRKFSSDVLDHRVNKLNENREQYAAKVKTVPHTLKRIETEETNGNVEVVYNIVKRMGKTMDEYFEVVDLPE